VAEERAHAADLRRSDPRLGEQVCSQEVGEGSPIDAVVLEPCGGDRPATSRVGEVRIVAEVLEQIEDPAPPVAGLEGHLGALGEIFQELSHRLRAVVDVAVHQLGAVSVQDGDLGPLAVNVHADVHTHLGLLS
jgi:hypothetical protein